MICESIEEIRAIYDEVWKSRDYRHKCHSFDLWHDMPQLWPKFKTCLDIGCGTGRLFNELNQLGFECWAVDISKNAVDKGISELWDHRLIISPIEEMLDVQLPQWRARWPFDVGVCTDVMEHIPEDRVETAIEAIHGICDHVIYKIANFPSSKHLTKKYDLHPTQRNVDWWVMMLEENGGDVVKLPYATHREEYLLQWTP